MDKPTRAAFERLLKIARSDTGQSRRVADFVLAWWNATDLGGFDLTDVFAVDKAIAEDMVTVFIWLSTLHNARYPEAYRADIEEIIRTWRPEVWARASATA
jgi:hypothetical protein